MHTGELDVVKDYLEEKEVLWKIKNFLSLKITSFYFAPDFKFMQSIWYLRIDPSENDYKDYMGLELRTDESQIADSICNLMCKFGVKKDDGSITACSYFTHAFSKQETKLTVHKFFSRNTLYECQQQVMPMESFTIICNLKFVDPLKQSLTDLCSLSENYKSLLTDEESCDTIIHVKEKKFKAHRLILVARSTVFAAMFKHETSEKKSGIINIPDCDPDSFPEFLKFLYCGRLENISFNSVLHLYETADKYDIQDLKRICIEYMSNNFTAKNICDVIFLAEKYYEAKLLAAARDFFNRNIVHIFISDEWKNFLKNNLYLANKLLIQMAANVEIIE